MLLDKMDGNDQESQSKALFLEIQKYYKLNPGLPWHLDHLTIQMIKMGNKPRKLKSYGAETRGLIGFLPVAGNKWLDKTNPYEQSVIHLCEALHSCYQCLSKDVIFGRDLAATRSRQFANL